MLSGSLIWISLFFSEHDDGRLWEVKPIDEEIFHALGVIEAALELVSGVPVRDAADHGLLPSMRRRRRPRRRRNRSRRQAAWIGNVGDAVADGASYRFGARRELQRGVAGRAVHQHHMHIHVWIRIRNRNRNQMSRLVRAE